MSVLEIRDLAIEIGGRPIVHDLRLTVALGEKVGVVGRNGAGKTSLLAVIAGESLPVAGGATVRGRLGYLRQDPRLHQTEVGGTAIRHVLQARALSEMEERLEKYRLAMEERPSDANVGRFSRLEERFQSAGGYAGEAEARRIAAGVGLSDDRLELPVAALSGGERRRLELTRILFAGSDLLLLDEPTNHLDGDAKRWLMRFLAAYRGAVMVVSHDLALLDDSITRIVHLDGDDVVQFRGTYSQYRAARRADETRRTALAERQRTEIKRLKTLADSMRGQTSKRARKAKTLDTRAARLADQAIAAPRRERTVHYRFPDPPRAGEIVLRVDGLTKGYGGPPVFEDVSFELRRGERLLVMGLNGAGKTSLLRLLAGVGTPDTGAATLGYGVSIGYYAQEHEGLDPDRSVIENLRAASVDATDQALRALLGMFGLVGPVAFQEAGSLSGGEKTKLAVAQLVAGRRNLILLDEPTNNLDPPSRTAIAEALAGWSGTMILVSHDVEFVRALEPHRVLSMPEGDLDFWDDELLELVSLA